MTEYAIFCEESSDHTAEEAVEAGFYSREEAERHMEKFYTDEDDTDLYVAKVEEPDEEDSEL